MREGNKERASRYFRLGCYVLLVGAAYCRILSAFHFNPLLTIWSDPARHWENATLPITHNPMNGIDPLGYQVWLMLILKLTNAESLAVAVYTALISIATPWIWYRFMRELLPQRELALLGWVILSWLPSWIGIFSYFMNETLLLALMGMSLWMTWRSVRKRTFESFVWAVVFWTATFMTKQVAAPMAAVCLTWLGCLQDQKAKKIGFAALFIGICLLVSGYRVYKIMNVWAPLGNGKMNEIYFRSGKAAIEFSLQRGDLGVGGWGFGSPSMYSPPFRPLSRWVSSRKDTHHFTIDLQKGNRDWALELEACKLSWCQRLRLQGENIIFLLWGTSWPDNNPDRLWDNLSNQTRWVWAPLVLIVLACNAILLVRKEFSLMPILSLTIWFLLFGLAVSPSEGRYRKPFEGLLVANSLWLVSHRRERRSRSLAI